MATPTGIPSWYDMLASARAAHQVVALANEFLARLEPSDVILLPTHCKPRQLGSAADVNAYAMDLKTCRYESPSQAHLVAELSRFIQEACQKLATLTGPQKAFPEIASWDHWDTSRQD